MEPLLVRCLYCGPFPVDPDKPAVEQIHAHSMSQGHRDLVLLDDELEERSPL